MYMIGSEEPHDTESEMVELIEGEPQITLSCPLPNAPITNVTVPLYDLPDPMSAALRVQPGPGEPCGPREPVGPVSPLGPGTPYVINASIA